MIEIDATEARANTKLPNAASYHSVTGLERLTGADILVHPFKALPDKLLDIPPHLAALRKRCEAGYLSQRKSGQDFVSSLSILDEILYRMREWSPNPYLVGTGIREGKGNTVVIVGSRRKQVYRWSSILGATMAWADGGGTPLLLRDDESITELLRLMEKRAIKHQEKPIKTVVHKVAQRPIAKEDQNWYNTGKAWPPGIGERMLAELAKYIQNTLELPPTLANAICVACSSVATNVKLWGPKSAKTVREWWGVDRAILPQDWGVQSGAWLYSTNLVELPSAFHDVRLYTGDGTFYLISGELYEDRKVPLAELREEGK